MPWSITFAAVLWSMTTVVAGQDPPRRVEGEPGPRLAAFVEGAAAFGFSGSVLAARAGKVVVALGVGPADVEGKQANTANTLFEIASLTKQFTAAAVLVLVQRKKLKLDDSIADHLPGVPDNCRPITVRHLLQHTSGIPATNGRGSGDDLSVVLPLFLDGGPQNAPGTHWEYWNQGYSLLAAIIERASGEGYVEFCKRELFDKATLTTARFTGDPEPEGIAAAIGVSAKGDPRSALAHPYGSYGYQYRGMGGAVCNVWDLWRWDRALCGTSVLDAACKQELFAPGLKDYALGWFVHEMNGRLVQRHGGSVRGFLSELRRYRANDALLCVLCNRTSGPFGPVVTGCEAILFGARIDVPKPLPTALGRELAGTWTSESMRLVVAEREGALCADLAPLGSTEWAVIQGVLAGRDLAALSWFDWQKTTPVRIERNGGRMDGLVFRGEKYRRQ